MENKALDTKIDYQQMEQARTKVLQNQLNQQLRTRELGNQYSLRRVILRMVVDGQYKEASEAIDVFMDAKAVYPGFRERSEVHVNHSKELINAVRAKRNFPNLSQLSMSKQQEILDHAIEHFDELRVTLKSIEHILKDETVKDIRLDCDGDTILLVVDQKDGIACHTGAHSCFFLGWDAKANTWQKSVE
jgi:hypothetical protein